MEQPPAEGNPPGWSTQQPPPFRGDPGWVMPNAPEQTQSGDPNPWGPPPAAPQPGVIPLRPLQVGEILTGAIEYVRRNPAAVIGVSAIVGFFAAMGQLAVIATGYGSLDTAQAQLNDNLETATLDDVVPLFRTLLIVTVLQSVIIALLQVMGSGMLAHVMGRAALGEHTSFGRAWGLVRPQIWRLLVATVLVGLAVLVAVVVPLLPGIVLAATVGAGVGGIALGLGGLISLALAIWVAFSLVLTTPVIALEDCGPLRGITRSGALVNGAFWRTLGIVLLGTILGQAVGAVVSAPFGLFGASGADLSTGSVFALALGGMVTMLVALPFIAGVTTLVYLDRRMRTENLAEVLAEAAGAANPLRTDTPAEPPNPGTPPTR